jgi:hypothetical protein
MAIQPTGSETTQLHGPLALLVSRRYPPWAFTVREARRLVADHLSAEATACREKLVLIASELATNAVCHAKTAYIVELYIGDVARVDVTDLAPFTPFVRAAPPAPGGRGLLLVSELSSRWGVDWHADYKVVWAELRRNGQD